MFLFLFIIFFLVFKVLILKKKLIEFISILKKVLLKFFIKINEKKVKKSLLKLV